MEQMLKERVESTSFDLPQNELIFTPKRGFTPTPSLFSEAVEEECRDLHKEFWCVNFHSKSD